MQLETEDVFSQAVGEVDGVSSVEVSVGPHKLYGIAADVQVTPDPTVDSKALEETIQHALGQYAVHYQLTIR